MGKCEWPNGTCEYAMAQETKPEDHHGRVWMHCEEGLSYSKASMARLMMFCLGNNIEIGSIHAFNPRYARCLVLAAIRLRPDQFDAFERETGGALRRPPRAKLNTQK